jgi:uncharacterized membrane protein
MRLRALIRRLAWIVGLALFLVATDVDAGRRGGSFGGRSGFGRSSRSSGSARSTGGGRVGSSGRRGGGVGGFVCIPIPFFGGGSFFNFIFFIIVIAVVIQVIRRMRR